MEKRVFSLTSVKEQLWTAGLYVFLYIMLAVVPAARSGWPRFRYHLVGAALLYAALGILAFLRERNRELEMTDEGLVVTTWRARPQLVPWEQVRSCRIVRNPGTQRRPFERILIYYSRWRCIPVLASCPDAAAILDALRQRLPESVFVAG